MNRASFLAGIAAAAATPAVALGQTETTPLRLQVDATAAGRAVGRDFVGLSYEMKALWWGELAPDPTYVALLRGLGRGNLRVGGNQVEFGLWSEDGKPQMVDQRDYPIGPADAAKLAALAEGADWTVTSGIALGHGEPQRSAAQAAGWQDALGARLVGIEIGNEPDTFFRKVRPETYRYADYAREWRAYAAVIDAQKRVRAPYTGPASAHDVYGFTIPFANEFRGRIAALSNHYYHGTAGANPTIAQLLARDATWPQRLTDLIAAANAANVPFRLAETNSISRGGTAGVSDVFAATLWGIRHMAQLLNMGAAGVNFHGGGPAIYTAIHWDDKTHAYTARPLYYALQAVAAMLPGRVLPSGATGEGPAGSASDIDSVAIVRDDGTLAVLVGNAGTNARALTLDPGRSVRAASARRITAPALDAKDVAFGKPEPLVAGGATVALALPAASAVLVEIA